MFVERHLAVAGARDAKGRAQAEQAGRQQPQRHWLLAAGTHRLSFGSRGGRITRCGRRTGQGEVSGARCSVLEGTCYMLGKEVEGWLVVCVEAMLRLGSGAVALELAWVQGGWAQTGYEYGPRTTEYYGVRSR